MFVAVYVFILTSFIKQSDGKGKWDSEIQLPFVWETPTGTDML